MKREESVEDGLPSDAHVETKEPVAVKQATVKEEQSTPAAKPPTNDATKMIISHSFTPSSGGETPPIEYNADTDDDMEEYSRFSEGQDASDGKHEKLNTCSNKRMRLRSDDSPPVEDISVATITTPAGPGFTTQAFMTKPLFHLNPFINAKKKKNIGFGPFIQAGIASAGVEKLPPSIACNVDILTYEQIRDRLGQERLGYI